MKQGKKNGMIINFEAG